MKKIAFLFLLLMCCVSCSVLTDPNWQVLNQCDRPIVYHGLSMPGLRTFEPHYDLENLKVNTYRSCGQIKESFMKAYKKQMEYREYNDKYFSPYVCDWNSMSSYDTNTSGGVTNRQEDLVDEADLVKVSPLYIFVAKNRGVQVVDRVSLKVVDYIFTTNLANTSLFVIDDFLVITGQKIENNYSKATSLVKVYKYPSPSEKELIKTFKFDGIFRRMSLVKNTLQVMTKNQLWLPNTDESQISNLLDEAIEKIDCENTHYISADLGSSELTTIHSIELSDNAIISDETSFTDVFDNVYLSSENLYLYKNLLRNKSTSLLVKLSTKKQGHSSLSVGHFPGYAISPWSFKEYDDKLVVASGQVGSERTSSLTVFQDNPSAQRLNKVSSVDGLAPGEQIRSVRYNNDKAYIVTFRTVDPLFIIDLANLFEPGLTSELKIPGYSSYLHNVGHDLLVGVGFSDTSRRSLQLSLFDVSDPYESRVIEQKGLLNVSSLVQYNHQAFFYDQQDEFIGIPYKKNIYANTKHQNSLGAQFYSITSTGFEEKGFVGHSELVTESCYSLVKNNPQMAAVKRIFKLDDHVFIFSDLAMTKSRVSNLENTVAAVKFECL